LTFRLDCEVVVLDLDDTLYLERDYVRSGFDAVSAHLRQTQGVDGFFSVAWGLFESGARRTVFNTALERLGVEPAADTIAELVDVYRKHAPKIALADDARRFLDDAGDHMQLALISDGPADSQSRKVQALGIEPAFGLILLTGAWGAEFSKPHARAFETVERHWPSVERRHIAYIADNPAKDFITPNARGWRTVHLKREQGEYARTVIAPGMGAEVQLPSFDLISVKPSRP
jgi:putative hydrolase of the HAD superfamily